MKIGMILRQHPPTRPSPIVPEMIRQLERRGATVVRIYPDAQLLDLAQIHVDCDLYVLKSGTELALSLAGILHAAGANVVNPYPASAMLRNKIIATRMLQAHGVPVPDTFTATTSQHLEPLLAAGPLVVKPYNGSEGRGVAVVENVASLSTIARPDAPLFAQRYHPPQGRDHKIYSIGEQIFGVRRVWPVKSYADKLGEPFAVPPALQEITRQCGRAFGIDLFGIDIIYSGNRPYVVDMSSFPGFKGVPDAARLLADYIEQRGLQIIAERQMKSMKPLLDNPGHELCALQSPLKLVAPEKANHV